MENRSIQSAVITGPADAFFHLAWDKTTGAGRNDMPAQISNIRHTVDAVRTAAALGCRVFVFAGSQAEYGRVDGVLTSDTPVHPENGYGMAKLCAGQMGRAECSKLGIDHVWLRVLSVYGPRDGETSMIGSTVGALLRGEKPALTAGEQNWDYLYAADAAQAFYLAALRGVGGRIYPLGSGQVRTIRDYAQALRDAIDPALPLGLGEVPYSPLQVMNLQADISALAEDTGFCPAWTFEAGIRETVSWAKAQRNR